MSSASHYHTRKCMRVSVHVTFTLGVCNHLSQEFPVGKNKILCSTFDFWRQTDHWRLWGAYAPRKKTLGLWQLVPPVSTFPAVDESL